MHTNSNKVYLIGNNILYSKSSLIHNAIYDYLGVNLRYEIKNIDCPYKLASFINQNFKKNFFVANITYPYKNLIYKFGIDNNFNISKSTLLSTGSNLLISSKKPSLFNFDGEGLVKFLQYKNIDIKDKKFVICSSGVTAKSVMYSLLKHQAAKIFMLTRDKNNINIDNFFINNSRILIDTYENISSDEIYDAEILIECAPPQKYQLIWKNDVLNLKNFRNCKNVIDVVYWKKANYLQNRCKECNINYFNGSGMLVSQAILCIQKILNFYNIETRNFSFLKLYNIGINAL